MLHNHILWISGMATTIIHSTALVHRRCRVSTAGRIRKNYQRAQLHMEVGNHFANRLRFFRRGLTDNPIYHIPPTVKTNTSLPKKPKNQTSVTGGGFNRTKWRTPTQLQHHPQARIVMKMLNTEFEMMVDWALRQV